MRKQGGAGLGMVMLIVVMAVVLVLVARSWREVGADAVAVTAPDLSTTVNDHGTGAGEELRNGGLPNLDVMRNETQAHSEELREALESTE
ncbi:MAG: hypothetical protein GY716_06145 [bacterium]|nr:hypothetical protein [bacterium]